LFIGWNGKNIIREPIEGTKPFEGARREMKGCGYLGGLSAMALLFMVSSAPSLAVPDFLLYDFSAAQEYPPKAPVGPALAESGLVLAGNGFASNSSAALPITLMVERGRIARPSHAKKLFDDLHRIDPSGGAGSKADAQSDYRGRMLLSGRAYILREIEISGRAEVSELKAGIFKTTFTGDLEVGRLSIETQRRGRFWDGRGTLTVEDGIIRGDYAVVLEISPQTQRAEEIPQIATVPRPDIPWISAAGPPP
jgi:hypothetical protein